MSATSVGTPASPVNARDELAHQVELCRGMQMGRYLQNGTIVDCVNDTYAIEVDFDDKWAEAIGQSLSYASTLQRLPGIILVCRENVDEGLCLSHLLRIEETVTYWHIGMTIWACTASATSLDECRKEELMQP
jgi:hypothetical protein